MIGPNKLLGLSVGSIGELLAVKPHEVDYVGIGPVFATTTKKNARPAMGIEGLQKIAEARAIPKVAIGGINAGNVESVMQTKVNGVAVVSAICGQEEVATATKQLVKLIGNIDE